MNYISYLKEGSGIHIKPSHKGRFTEYCNGKVTRECINRGKRSPNPKIRKQAVFAENARTWKHYDGGELKYSKEYWNALLASLLSKEEDTPKQQVYFNAVDNDSKQEFNYSAPGKNEPVIPEGNSEGNEEEPYSDDWITELRRSLRRERSSTTSTGNNPVSTGNNPTSTGNNPTSTGSTGRYTSNWEEFRDNLYNELKSRGYSEETAKVMTAQMGQESGHGQHLVGDYNYSNITKGRNWSGRTATVQGNSNVFRSYDNFSQAISDYIKLNEVYGITKDTPKDEVIDRWLGNNEKDLAWNGKNNTRYKDRINEVYKMYWG